ncbi:hypothetical protein K488DRAFT_82946 [Vararia minispora EC-137]|uniref:Uncharacterized protein n=1 Tax=Vararia minispora EC-137 TaxID=1314806 RepID=A0ACB8QUK5_9AGAM|nr:hypothetical protein K488DRAFT_82946 [Vararia minispora EC-137]
MLTGRMGGRLSVTSSRLRGSNQAILGRYGQFPVTVACAFNADFKLLKLKGYNLEKPEAKSLPWRSGYIPIDNEGDVLPLQSLEFDVPPLGVHGIQLFAKDHPYWAKLAENPSTDSKDAWLFPAGTRLPTELTLIHRGEHEYYIRPSWPQSLRTFNTALTWYQNYHMRKTPLRRFLECEDVEAFVKHLNPPNTRNSHRADGYGILSGRQTGP